jgi:hypothetical protein
MEPLTVHAYFAEKETLLEVFDTWPDEMGAIVLLEDDEGHHISLYHEEEADRILGRLGHRLGIPHEELILVSPEGVGPPAEGHPRVRIKFSDDREIIDLIGLQRDLPERARDYRVNFEYVRDQGLGTGLDADLNPITPEGEEPLVFTPIPRASHRPAQKEIGWGDIGPDAPAPFPLAPQASEEEDLSCFDVPAAPDLVREYRIFDGTAMIRSDMVVLRPSGAGRDQPREVPVLGFRDDLSDILLPADALDPDESGALPALTLPLRSLPEGLVQATPFPRRVRISVTPWGVRVRPVTGLLGLISPQPARVTLQVALALLLLMNVGLAVGLGAGLLSGPSGP